MKKLSLALMLVAMLTPTLAQHNHTASATPIQAAQTPGNYRLPDVVVIRQDGVNLPFPAVVDDGRPVMLNFVYTTCTAVCPITSQVFAEVRGLLGEHRDHVNMVSVSIDPEHDTPRALKTYAKKYGAYGTWTHITSTTAGSVMIQRAFEVWRGDKMNHTPTTFIRCSPSKPWIRFDGFATPQDLVKGLACAS